MSEVDWRWIKMCVNDIEYDYTNMYRIYRDGKVQSVKRKGILKNRFLKEMTHKTGYKYVGLYKDKQSLYLIHRLVACHFIPNPHNFLVIDHKNQEKDDNRIENLRWCSYSTNLRNRTKKRSKHNLPRGVHLIPSGKYIVQITINSKTKYLGTYETKEEASDIYEEVLRKRMNNELNNIHL